MIFRILYGTIYSLLLVALTGMPQTALAVVSCQDTINPNTSIRYSDALVSFKEYNGKTYAIAKSAATGGTSLSAAPKARSTSSRSTTRPRGSRSRSRACAPPAVAQTARGYG